MRGDCSLSCFAGLLGLTIVCMPLAQAAEKDELASAKRLIEQVQMALVRASLAEKSAETVKPPRYAFDYPSIQTDLNTLKAGIDHYLMPSRDQPQNSELLSGHYRQENPQ